MTGPTVMARILAPYSRLRTGAHSAIWAIVPVSIRYSRIYAVTGKGYHLNAIRDFRRATVFATGRLECQGLF